MNRPTLASRFNRQHARTACLRQQGAASLMVTLGLCAVLLLATLMAHRGLLLEVRMSSNQVRSTVAFEAAEAGIEWATAQLNRPQRIDAGCREGAGASTSFRERYLSMTLAPGGFTGRSWNQGGTPVALQAACVRGSSEWNCHCPSDGPAVLPDPAGSATAPAFRVQFEPGGQAGVLRVVAIGCSRLAAPCVPAGTGAGPGAEASARVEVALALLPALSSTPAAPLTVRGAIDTPAALGLINEDARSGGLGAHAGGVIAAPLARIVTPAGSSSADALAGQDAALATSGADTFFASWFGLSKDAWRQQAVVQRVDCRSACEQALADAIDAAAGPAQIWIDGDLPLQGPLTLGSAQRPVIIIATGTVRLQGAVQLHGVLYAGDITWQQAAAPGAFVRGALVSEGGYSGDATPDLVYDAAVLATLRSLSGNLVRVPGSWRDF